MEKFIEHTGKVIPLFMKDIDTDMIIPAQYMTSVSREGYAEHLFVRLKASDPHFPFNNPKYKDASILIGGSNFGCGSSREHAVWALLGAGIKIIIAPSFADIFYNNSSKNGLLLITLPFEIVSAIASDASEREAFLNINLEEQILFFERRMDDKNLITNQNEIYNFEIDPFKKHCFINGFDELDYLLSHKEIIKDYFSPHK
jgi:3-isopropylmalate/(R)-2-methylmalate dehydratase small subunit